MFVFFQDLEGLTEVSGGMSAGTSGRNFGLWADFSFLIIRNSELATTHQKQPPHTKTGNEFLKSTSPRAEQRYPLPTSHPKMSFFGGLSISHIQMTFTMSKKRNFKPDKSLNRLRTAAAPLPIEAQTTNQSADPTYVWT